MELNALHHSFCKEIKAKPGWCGSDPLECMHSNWQRMLFLSLPLGRCCPDFISCSGLKPWTPAWPSMPPKRHTCGSSSIWVTIWDTTRPLAMHSGFPNTNSHHHCFSMPSTASRCTTASANWMQLTPCGGCTRWDHSTLAWGRMGYLVIQTACRGLGGVMEEAFPGSMWLQLKMDEGTNICSHAHGTGWSGWKCRPLQGLSWLCKANHAPNLCHWWHMNQPLS